jgi:hypothetical protein
MMSGKNQASQQPTAMGSMLQASTYGLPVPEILGMTQSPLLVTWANGMRQGGSGKKLKNLKKGITAYEENITFACGVNPLICALQLWSNGAKYPLEFTSQTFSYHAGGAITISDSDFYAVIAVTKTESYSETFNDYGDPNAPRSVSGSWERPFWNQLIAGPDPTDQSGQRYYPYCYRWKPSYGATFYVDAMGDGPFTGTFTVYYAKWTAATSYQSPLTRLRLHWESELGDGDEYDGYSAEQILYPQYAGMGSASLDLGSSGAIPQLLSEILGKFSVYSTGDGDFVDFVEYIFKSGALQAGLDSAVRFGGVQTGVGLFDFPGAVQKTYASRFETHNNALGFDLPNTAGNTLLAFCSTDSATPPVPSDTLGNTWTLLATGPNNDGRGGTFSLYACADCLAGANAVTWANYGFYNGLPVLLELPADTLDVYASSAGANPSVSVTTTNTPGQASILLGFAVSCTPGAANFNPAILGPLSSLLTVTQRLVTTPGTYSLSAAGGSGASLILLALKSSQPPTYANPLPNILDPVTRELTRAQCRANRLWGSLSMNSQQAAREWIQNCLDAANCVAVMSGFSLKLMPRSEVSAAGNGLVYNAPTASGPVADLDVDAGDFVAAKNELPLQFKRPARTDLSTVLQMQHINRSSDYQQIVSQFPDTANIMKYGTRLKDPVVNNAIQDPAIAMALLRVMVRRRNWVECLGATFKLNARWQHLEAMDLVTITWRAMGLVKMPFRLTSADDDDGCLLNCEAEPWYYGMHSPVAQTFDGTTPYSPQVNNAAGSVNAPVIFEPPPRLYGAQNQAQLWIVTSSSNADYLGCQPYISTDGGTSYQTAGDPVVGNGVTGVTTADWPAASDPDTTNDLAVDLTESVGELASYQTADEDNFVYPCYVEGGGSYDIPFELMAYATATLTATSKYTLKATGSGNKLRRGVWGCPAAATGVDHPTGSRFALLPPDGAGIVKLTMDPKWIGKTLYFKFPTFNTFGGAAQSLSDCTAYSYTPTGDSGSVNPAGLAAAGFQVNGA